jgi:hypothetical protein
MKEEQDDLTLVYMYGFKNGERGMKVDIEQLNKLLDTIGKINATLTATVIEKNDEIERLRAVLRRISHAPHGKVYCADGHEEAVLIARVALEGEKE